tara:strand:+ start:2724 stop:3467 length:744 start_codon:yes stop_codon:yes gene_type:complete
MNKLCIITGSSGGIGTALVRKYCDEGFNVAGFDIEPKNIKQNSYDFYQLDLSDLHNENKLNFISETFSQISKQKFEDVILINNAAIQDLKTIGNIKHEDLQKTFSVNIFAPVLISKEFVKAFKCPKKIINIGSIHSKLTKKHFTLYAASKAALKSFSNSMSIEGVKDVTVLHVDPGAIETNMLKDSFKNNQENFKTLENSIPKKIPSPEDFAEFIFYFSSINSDYINGSSISYDGGVSNLLNDPDNK